MTLFLHADMAASSIVIETTYGCLRFEKVDELIDHVKVELLQTIYLLSVFQNVEKDRSDTLHPLEQVTQTEPTDSRRLVKSRSGIPCKKKVLSNRKNNDLNRFEHCVIIKNLINMIIFDYLEDFNRFFSHITLVLKVTSDFNRYLTKYAIKYDTG